MTRFLIDVTRAAGVRVARRPQDGMDRATLAYIRRYGSEASALLRVLGRGLILPRDESQQLFYELTSDGAGLTPRRMWDAARAGASLFFLRDRAGTVLFNLAHSGLESPNHMDYLDAMGVKPVFMLHSLIPITHPEYAGDGERARHTARMHHVLTRAAGVVATSSTTAMALDDFARRAGRSLPPSTVAPLAADPLPPCAPHRPILRPYFVAVGTIEARRNQLMLLQVWRDLASRLGDAVPHLVLIGRRGRDASPAASMLDRCPGLRGCVTELPECDDGALATYLRHAQALLDPAYAHGNAAAIVQALSFGTPVLASDLPVSREVASDLPEYIDPLNAAAWAERITEYARAHSLARATQKDRASRYKATDWDDHFRRVDLLLGQIT